MNTTTVTRSPAQLVRSYRDRIAADPDLYDGDLDVIMWLVEDTAERSWTPSEAGRVVKIATHEARRMLEQLTREGHIRSDNRGGWTRYTARYNPNA